MSSDWAAADTVAKLLALRAAQTPQAVGFEERLGAGPWQPTTWGAFAEKVALLRRALFAAGLRRGDRLALIAPVSLQWETLNHAALGMGVTVVGMDAHDLPERIAGMAKLAGVVAFAVADPAVLARLEAAQWAAARFVLHLGGAASPTTTPDAGPRQWTWSAFEALGQAETADPEAPTADDVATVIFTSGTTGAPKGIPYTHAQVCAAVAAIAEAFSFVGPQSRMLCWLPLSNLFQRMVNLAAMRQGAATWFLADPRQVMDVVGQVCPDVFVAVPRFFEKLYDGLRSNIAAQPWLRRTLVAGAWDLGRRRSRLQLQGLPVPAWLALVHRVAERLVLSRVRAVMGQRLVCMVSGSAPLSGILLSEFHALGWLVLEAYGLSENVLPMAMNRFDSYRLGSVGRPLAGNQIELDEGGQVRVKGRGVFAGYLGDLVAPLDAQGFYLTGDLGEWDADGFLRLTGRAGDLIKTSTGRRVAPIGVEAQLRDLAEIDQVVLIGHGRKCLVALCTPSQPEWGWPEPNAIRQRLKALLSRVNPHERPSGLALLGRPFTIDDGELTSNLKIKRGAVERNHAVLVQQLYDAIDQRGDGGASDLTILVAPSPPPRPPQPQATP